MSEEHKQSDQNQRRSDQHFSPFADCLLNGENTRPRTQHSNQHRTQQRVGRDTSERVKQTIEKNAAAVFQILRDITHRGDVRRQRAGAYGGQQAEQKSGQYRNGRAVQQVLQTFHTYSPNCFRISAQSSALNCSGFVRALAKANCVKSVTVSFPSRHLFSNSADHVTSYLSANASFSGFAR